MWACSEYLPEWVKVVKDWRRSQAVHPRKRGLAFDSNVDIRVSGPFAVARGGNVIPL